MIAPHHMCKEKVQRLEQFSRQQLSRTYPFCFGLNKIIHQSKTIRVRGNKDK